MDQIFNELSVSSCYVDQYRARLGMEDVIAVSRDLHRRGFSPDIRSREDFSSRHLSTEYTVFQWTIDKTVDNDLRRYFLTHATKSPYVEFLIREEDTSEELREFLYEDSEALGLGLAHLWESPSLSLCGDARFAKDPVQITQRVLTDEGNLIEQMVEVCTLCRQEQVETRSSWIQDRLQRTVKSGRDLIENSVNVLPHLLFSQNAIDQILLLTGREQYFPEMVRHLFILETAIRDWQNGVLQLGGLTYSPESESTMKKREFREKRQFLCQDGQVRTFSLHTKIKSANKRIYFFPIPEEWIVHIGYMGDHLPTVLYPT
jgi:hypothetical protein